LVNISRTQIIGQHLVRRGHQVEMLTGTRFADLVK
jgi:hypothetical protein